MESMDIKTKMYIESMVNQDFFMLWCFSHQKIEKIAK